MSQKERRSPANDLPQALRIPATLHSLQVKEFLLPAAFYKSAGDATALTLEACREILEASAAETHDAQLREDVATLQAMLPDIAERLSKPRIRDMAKFFGVSKYEARKNLTMPQLHDKVKNAFTVRVLELRMVALLAPEKLRNCLQWLSAQRTRQPALGKLCDEMSRLLAQSRPDQRTVREIATALGKNDREFRQMTLPEQVELVKEEFERHVQRIQRGPIGMWGKQAGSDSSQLTAHSDAVASTAPSNRSDATQFAPQSVSIAPAAVQPTLDSSLVSSHARPATRQGFWWLPEMRAARKYVASVPSPAKGTDENFNIVCQRLRHSEITNQKR